MSLFSNDCVRTDGKKHKKECEGCGCETVRNLPLRANVNITIGGSNATTSNLYFAGFNPHNCCAYFVDPVADNDVDVLVIDCTKIEAVRIL